jgi:antirestriction protein ArdC
MTKAEQQAQSLTNALQSQSVMNYAGIFEGFAAKGIPMDAIAPRENVFTYNAWLALGRQVRKGEHGVKVVTFIVCSKQDKKTGRPWSTTVFHVSQTDEVISTDVDLENSAGGAA